MVRKALFSSRAQRWRDWALFALAASCPAIAVGWLGLRALEGQEDASRRQVKAALQAIAERTARSAQDEMESASLELGRASLPTSLLDIERQLQPFRPRFADLVVLTADGNVLIPPPPSKTVGKTGAWEKDVPPRCATLADELARSPGSDVPAKEFLSDCEGFRTSSGRWLWPMVALRTRDGNQAELAEWIESNAGSMRRAEREATRREAMAASWLRGEERDRVLGALSPGASFHEGLSRALEERGPAAALRAGPDPTGFVRFRANSSWGVLRQIPEARLVGFVVHPRSVQAAADRGWPELPADYRAIVTRGEATVESEFGWRVPLSPSLGLRIGLTDPSLPARQAARDRFVLVLVGTGTMLLAFLVAALLFARMRAAKRLGELRAGFVSTVSHELRTPIASVRMLAELLDQGRVEEQEKPEIHAALAREAQRLGDTVDRLLGFSRMAAGRHVIQRKEASIATLLDRSIATFEDRHPALSPVLRHYPASLSGDVDESQLQLAVDNLLSNASKYAPLGTPYEVRAREEGSFVVLEVADHGPGIPRRDRRRVLKPFERGDDRLSTQVQGSGIGLSLVDHVARAHGGEVQVVAEPGGGACVRLRFPRRVE